MFSIITICAAAYILGVVLSPLISLPYFLLFIICLLIAAVILRLLLKYRISAILLVAVMLLFGCVRCNISLKNALFESFPEKYIEIDGTVCSLPKASQSKYKYRYEVDLNSVKYLENTYKTNARILLNTEEELGYGDTVTAWGFLTDFSDVSNEFEFNYKLFYKSRGILSRLTALEINKTGEISSLSPSFLAGKMKCRIYENMKAVLRPDDFAIACAVIFGDKSNFDKEYSSLLTRTGVFRIFYSPFSHISIILIAAALIFSKKKRQNIFFIVLLVLYLIFVNSSSVAIKAGITAVLVLLMNRLKGYSDKLSILSFTALLLTLINPLLCFDGGFMVSVISSVLLCLSYRHVYKFLSKCRPLKRLRLAAPLSLWFILSFGALPFSAYYFGGISVYSVLLVPIVLPFVALVILLAPFMFLKVSGLTVLLMPVFASAEAILRAFPSWVAKLPFYYVALPKPSVIKILFYCLLWWAFIRTIRLKFHTYQTKMILSAAMGIFICIVIDFGINPLCLYFVNVGQGDAAILHTNRGETVIIDGGGASDYEETYNVGDSIFVPYLVSHGFTRIDTAIVSHYHKDHVEGIISAAENLRINTLILPDCMPQNKYRLKLEEIAEKRHIKIEYLGLGDEIRFRSGLNLSVIAPDNALIDKENENDTSLVIKVCYGKVTALFTGDFEAEEDLLPPQNVDILKVGHHGSKDANDFDFLHAVNPRIAVISVGRRNRYGLPSSGVTAELENMGAAVLRTDYLGDIRCTADKKGNIKYNSLLGGKHYDSKRR